MLHHHIRSHFLIPGASSQKMHVRGKVIGNNTFLSSFPTTSVHLLLLQPLARPETSTSQVFLCQESWGGALSSPGHSKSPRYVIKHGRAGCDNYKKHRERPRSRRETCRPQRKERGGSREKHLMSSAHQAGGTSPVTGGHPAWDIPDTSDKWRSWSLSVG